MKFVPTEVQKIPVTILSRCQRFDFAGIGTAHYRTAPGSRRRQKSEADDGSGMDRTPGGGSMRDAHPLDQLLAFNEENQRLTLEHVHRLLGTADDDRIVALAGAVLAHDAKQALALLDSAADAGAQLGELLDQLIAYWRDLMVVNCAGLEGKDLSITAKHRPTLAKQAQAVSIETILAGLDILNSTKARLRTSQYGRVLCWKWLSFAWECWRISSLCRTGRGFPQDRQPGAKRNRPEPAATDASASNRGSRCTSPRAQATALGLTEQSLPQVWSRRCPGRCDPRRAPGPKPWAEPLYRRYPGDALRQPIIRIKLTARSRAPPCRDALKKVTGQTWNVRFESMRAKVLPAAAVRAKPHNPVIARKGTKPGRSL